jgi:hypothetical protein
LVPATFPRPGRRLHIGGAGSYAFLEELLLLLYRVLQGYQLLLLRREKRSQLSDLFIRRRRSRSGSTGTRGYCVIRPM